MRGDRVALRVNDLLELFDHALEFLDVDLTRQSLNLIVNLGRRFFQRLETVDLFA